jgi:hypothetical protein
VGGIGHRKGGTGCQRAPVLAECSGEVALHFQDRAEKKWPGVSPVRSPLRVSG